MRRIAAICFLVGLFAGAPAAAGASECPRECGRYELGRATFAGALTAGPQHAIWFVSESFEEPEFALGKVTPVGDVTKFPLTVPPPPRQSYRRGVTIAVGSDGNLWFGEDKAIGRSTTAGEVTSFDLPAGGTAPISMALGPDGNVWFTEGGASRIGRITPAGDIWEYQLSGGRRPSGIVAGPDGNLWFTERTANLIGRMTPTGELEEFVVPGPPAKLASIAAGPDGNLWFTEAASPVVGKITPTGAVTQYRVPTAGGTEAIVAGPGRRLYFTSGSEVGAISTAGKISWPSCLLGFCNAPAETLAMGPDGRLWGAVGPQECLALCGGSTGQYYGALPGHLAPFELPPPRLEIGPRLSRLRGRHTTIPVVCGLKGGCRGSLKVGVYVAHDTTLLFRTLTTAPIDLRRDESRRITLTFPARIAARLRRHRHAHLLAFADGPDGSHARRGLSLPTR